MVQSNVIIDQGSRVPTASLSVACCIRQGPALGAPRLVEIIDRVYDSFEGRCVRGIALSEPMILKHVDLCLRAQVINRLITCCRLLMLRLPLIMVLLLVLMVLKVLLSLMLLSGTGGEQVARRPVLLIKVVSLGLEVSVL